jgi:hypothetical protein
LRRPPSPREPVTAQIAQISRSTSASASAGGPFFLLSIRSLLILASHQNRLLPFFDLTPAHTDHVVYPGAERVKRLATILQPLLILCWNSAATGSCEAPVFLHIEVLPVFNYPFCPLVPMPANTPTGPHAETGSMVPESSWHLTRRAEGRQESAARGVCPRVRPAHPTIRIPSPAISSPPAATRCTTIAHPAPWFCSLVD